MLVGLARAGVYWNKLALFGLAIEVFFESCNPLLHVSTAAVPAHGARLAHGPPSSWLTNVPLPTWQVLGCMRIAGATSTPAYATLSQLFIAQFFLFRVVVSNFYFAWLLVTVVQLTVQPWWAWAGVGVFGSLNLLNALWLYKLVHMLASDRRLLAKQSCAAAEAASKDAAVAAKQQLAAHADGARKWD